MSDLYQPSDNPETRPFWEAADKGRFLLKGCNGCGQKHYYPRSLCPTCFSADTVWIEAAGQGVVYSYCSTRRGETAHTIAYVTLDEGPTILTNIVDAEPDQIRVGARVILSFRRAADGRNLAMFVLCDEAAAVNGDRRASTTKGA